VAVAVGVAEALGVADGVESGSVGVGTGGSVSGGNGSRDASVGGADVAVGTPVAGTDVGIPRAGRTAEGSTDGSADGSCVDTDDEAGAGAGLVCRAGASPIPPAPPGVSSIAAERVAGVASCQPTVTAIGRPSATSPKKMDLGDNRT
jgi:hypothetical protein